MAQIGVIVPVYRVEQYLERCVRSILNQTFPDLCLIMFHVDWPQCYNFPI